MQVLLKQSLGLQLTQCHLISGAGGKFSFNRSINTFRHILFWLNVMAYLIKYSVYTISNVNGMIPLNERHILYYPELKVLTPAMNSKA